ncbi:DNA (cytosine-5-)-methyltransferase [Spongiimicrobium salis]|uniref:DNA (cytosine-5-)-methyltransferase n=1 Tax=Spongiimicrobium salis TaxID=1667022 RepID=UPI00374DC2A8
MLRIGSDCSGIGAFNEALKRKNIHYENVFSCDYDYYARLTYLINNGTPKDIKLAKTKEHKRYADKVKEIALRDKNPSQKESEFLQEANEFAKKFSFYYPFNMYQREVPEKPLDIYVSTVPCQSFSLSGKREGENDKRGILFYNSLEFIRENNPRYFIFENVKGLLSHDKDPNDPKNPIGRTFNKWVHYLGGKSVDGVFPIFPNDWAVPYHIYIKVINATEFNVPQNRERVFIVGIRDDMDNNFTWPKPLPLTKRLRDVLEDEVDEKYFLSDEQVANMMNSKNPNIEGFINQETQASKVYGIDRVSPTISAGTHGYANGFIKVKSATKCGYEVAQPGDSVNLSVPNSVTRRGRVGNQVAQTLDTACNQAVIVLGGRMVGRNPENPKSRNSGEDLKQMIEINENPLISNTLSTVQKDNLLMYKVIQLNPSQESGGVQPYQQNRIYDPNGLSPAIVSGLGGERMHNIQLGYRIRRLTPRECARLMDFPDDFKIEVSDTQTYKQAGNSVVVAKYEKLLEKILK